MLLVIWLHLWRDMARALLVVLSIAVGVFALGLALGTLNVMRASIKQDKQTSQPAARSTFSFPPSARSK